MSFRPGVLSCHTPRSHPVQSPIPTPEDLKHFFDRFHDIPLLFFALDELLDDLLRYAFHVESPSLSLGSYPYYFQVELLLHNFFHGF